MSSYIGIVKAGSGTEWYVYWNDNYEVYVGEGGTHYVGKADSASQAMKMAEAFVYKW